MARIAARTLNVSVNSVAVEDELNSFDLSVDQELPVVTSFADAGPREVAANYDWKASGGGSADFAGSQGDATYFAMLGSSSGVALDVDPTGTTAGADNPHYTGTVHLSSLKLSWKTGAAATYGVDLQGNSALTRAVA